MTNIPPKNNRKFKPIKISDSLRGINQKFLYKFGKLDYTIHAKWDEIVGSFFVQFAPWKYPFILFIPAKKFRLDC